jgi:hypothetical protein
MTGLPDENKPAFNAAAAALRAANYDVVNPAELPDGWTWKEYLKRGLNDLTGCNGMAMLDGWEDSPGARQEVSEGLRMDLRVRLLNAWFESE